MARFLFETSPLDPLTYALVPVLFCLLALIAAWAPAQRAASVDPMIALRND
jgi:ABC-type lipoprotein release transport system permease subunit